jgi:acetyl esterase/lipase
VTTELNPGLEPVLSPLLAVSAQMDKPAVGDVATRRASAQLLFGQLADARPPVPQVQTESFELTAEDGAVVPMRWYRPASAAGAAVLYLHGGGMIYGLDTVGALYDSVVRGYVAASGVPMLVPDYRVAPEHPHPAPVHDSYAALVWLAEHAAELGVDPARIAVMGDSAGGGLTAGVGLLARDRGGPAIAQQLLIYPMLDDRTPAPDCAVAPLLTWSYDDNLTGWGALLGAGPDRSTVGGTDEVSVYAAPARAEDLSGLPPSYVDTGDLDLFHAEVTSYASALEKSGVPTELHVMPGCPHAFELLAPDAPVSQQVVAERVRRLRSL